MATRETLKEDGGKSSSSSSRPRPSSMAAVKTAAAIIASKNPAAPMSSAPTPPNHPAPVSTPTPTPTPSSSQKQQLVVAKQSHEPLPPLSAGAPRTLLSLQSKIPAASMQQIPAMPKTKPKNNAVNTATNVDNNQDTIQHLRSGKWTIEEELYANILIQLFEEGRVDKFEHINDGDNNNSNSNNSEEETQQQTPTFKITNGMTLRAYLSRKLFCSPMRISKKFAGKGIGKLVYTSQSPSTYYHQRQRQAQIFPFSSSTPIISNNMNIHAHSLPSVASHWSQMKLAESNFLRVAFPNGGGPMNVKKRTSIHPSPLKATSLFASPSANKRSLSSQLEFKGNSSTKSSRPKKVSRVGTSSHGSLEMQAPLTVSGKVSSSSIQPNLGDTTNSTSPELLNEYKYPYQQQNEQRREQHCSATTGQSPLAPATTRVAPFSCPSLSQNARNPTYTPLAPFPTNVLQLQHNFKNASSPSAVTSSPNSYESSLSQKQKSPLMAAPQLLSPNSKLHQMQGQPKRQRVQDRNQSQIQVLEEAYLNSVSTNKPHVSKNDKTNTITSVLAASPKLPAQLVHNAQPTTKIEGFDYNQMIGVSPKPENDLPNFLTGFDKISKHQSASKDRTECDLSAQFSPAYHTSKSFDDFHRYLGKGLSPTVSPPPQFPNLRTTNAGPGIPSIESSDVASTSNLQMRPRKQPNTASDKISSDTTSSKSSSSILEKRSDESLLIEAYAEAIKSSHGCQQAIQTTQEQGKIDVSCLDRYHNSFVLSQQWANPSQGKDQERPCPCCDPTQQHKPEEPLIFDFPLEGMTFEDFETLAPFHGTSDMCGTVSDPSDGSEGPSTDDLDHTMLEGYCKGKRKKLMSIPEQSAMTCGRSSVKL